MIGVDDTMAKIIWSRYFIDSWEYYIAHNKLIQDNKSAMVLEKNVKFSR